MAPISKLRVCYCFVSDRKSCKYPRNYRIQSTDLSWHVYFDLWKFVCEWCWSQPQFQSWKRSIQPLVLPRGNPGPQMSIHVKDRTDFSRTSNNLWLVSTPWNVGLQVCWSDFIPGCSLGQFCHLGMDWTVVLFVCTFHRDTWLAWVYQSHRNRSWMRCFSVVLSWGLNSESLQNGARCQWHRLNLGLHAWVSRFLVLHSSRSIPIFPLN